MHNSKCWLAGRSSYRVRLQHNTLIEGSFSGISCRKKSTQWEYPMLLHEFIPCGFCPWKCLTCSQQTQLSQKLHSQKEVVSLRKTPIEFDSPMRVAQQQTCRRFFHFAWINKAYGSCCGCLMPWRTELNAFECAPQRINAWFCRRPARKQNTKRIYFSVGSPTYRCTYNFL